MKVVDLGNRRETECVGEVWPDRRCCNESMEVSGSCLCSRCDEDNKRRSGQEQEWEKGLYAMSASRCPQRPRKSYVARLDTDMALLLCFQPTDVDSL
jgi:hypothetical protein